MPFSTWPKLFRSHKDARVFLISISLVVIVFLAFITFTRYRTVNDLLIRTMRHEAESYISLIVASRHWNAGYGGVYVIQPPGAPTNSYLRDMGIDPDIRAADGRVLTLKNPAIMTREISETTARSGQVRFHMVSGRPLNPENRPDALELEALRLFDQGASSYWTIDRLSSPPFFRYIAPLRVEGSCLRCHERQGYREGDLRGAVSVLIPAGELLRQIRRNASQMTIGFLVAAGLLLGVLYFLTWKLFVRLDEIQRRLRHMAVTDELTGLKNRRFIMEQLDKELQRALRSGDPLSLLILDLDHFKKINDSLGHVFGDIVLKRVAEEMEKSLRSYDLLGRLGGEEFLVASPGSSREDATALAERIRERIREMTVSNQVHTVSITVSAGVTSLRSEDHTVSDFLRRADKALYQAKEQGRDRVVSL